MGYINPKFKKNWDRIYKNNKRIKELLEENNELGKKLARHFGARIAQITKRERRKK